MRPILVLAALWVAGCTQPAGPAQPISRGEFSFHFSNFMPGVPDAAPQPILPGVYVKITTIDPEAGEVEWKGIHRQGAVLGISEEDGKPASVHLVFSPKLGKMVRIDFNTETRIERIEVDKLQPYEVMRCPILDQPLEECPGPASNKAFIRINRVVYSKLLGERNEVVQDAGTCRIPDSRCSIHGGESSPSWSPEQLKLARTHRALLLHMDAESFWSSRNPKLRRRAQENYRKLLATYGDLDLVTQNRSRIEKRAAATIDE